MKPAKKSNLYNQQINGVYGEIGGAGNARLMYVQTALSFDDLKLVTLVADIKGSEKWPIRELFQREVDHERVKRDLVPYFTSDEKVKFFNPITLVLLPLNDDGSVLAENKYLEKKNVIEDGDNYEVFENETFYRFLNYADNSAFSIVEWSDKKVKLVAIDGQHRISALKALAEDAVSRGIGDWKIPVVIASPRKQDSSKSSEKILSIIRSIFVYINNNAQAINLSRGVLLDDHQISSVATQELIQKCHDNDLLTKPKIDIPPLLFFDWRGLEEKGEKKDALSAIKSTVELSRLFDYYMFPEDEEFLRARIFLSAEDNEINIQSHMETRETKKIREQINRDIIPGVLHLIKSFTPYKNYIDALVSIANTNDPFEKRIIEELRFGLRDYTKSEKAALDASREKIVGKIKDLKAAMPSLFQLDVAFRGVFSSFCDLKYSLSHENEDYALNVSWTDFSSAFVESLNEIYALNYLSFVSKKSSDLLRNIVIDDRDSIINYRHEDAQQALGRYISVLVIKRIKLDGLEDEFREELIEDSLDALRDRIKRSARKRIRADLKDKNPRWTKTKLDTESNLEANKYAEGRCKKILTL